MLIGESPPSTGSEYPAGDGNSVVLAGKGGVCLKIRLTHGMRGRVINIMSQGRGGGGGGSSRRHPSFESLPSGN